MKFSLYTANKDNEERLKRQNDRLNGRVCSILRLMPGQVADMTFPDINRLPTEYIATSMQYLGPETGYATKNYGIMNYSACDAGDIFAA